MKLTATFAALLAGTTHRRRRASACEMTLRSSDTHPDGYPTVAAVQEMGRLLEEKTGGRLCVEVFHSAQLGEEKDTIEQTRFGVIDLNRISMAPFNGLIPETAILSLPYLFRDVDHLHNVLDGPIGQQVLDTLHRPGPDRARLLRPGRALLLQPREADQVDRRHEGPEVPRHPVRRLRRHGGRPRRQRRADALRRGLFGDRDRRHRRRREQLAVLRVLRPLRGGEVLHPRRAHDGARGAGDVEDLLRQALARGPGRSSARPPRTRSPFNREKWAAREKESEEKVLAAGVEVVRDIDKAPFQAAMGPVYEKYAATPEMKKLVEDIQATE